MHDPRTFTAALEQWYRHQSRDLPWRKTSDPYAIWVSEIMLQQTQVGRVADTFYPRFLEAFPNIETLAAAGWDSVYPLWKGLGYYRRGQNMIRAAQIIMQDHEGIFPRDIKTLLQLPGIGAYTARAIISFAWDEKLPAIDTNIRKVISVLWPRNNIERQAERLIACATSGRDWNSAMMDLSSALRAGEPIEGDLGGFFPPEVAQKFRPKPKPKKATNKNLPAKKKIYVGVACIYRDGKYLIQTRPKGKSFSGSWEFPGGKREPKEDIRHCVKREIMEEIGVDISVRPPFHQERLEFPYVTLMLTFHRCQIQSGEPKPLEKQKIRWVAPDEFEQVGFLETNANAVEKLRKMPC